MERQPLLDAIAALPDEAFTHVAHVAHDIARRLPGEDFSALGTAARGVLGLPEPQPESALPAPAEPSANDVTVDLTGVEGTIEQGKVG